MLEGPIGAAAFNNEFGRPNLTGYFRTYEQDVAGTVRGYHKPIMIAGGLGTIQAEQSFKEETFPVGTKFIQLGGPGMLIGLGGGAASSMTAGSNAEDLDFASVQRGNPEIQRRAQEVIDRCWQMGKNNPILSVHDVGAGGVSNALPELAHSGGVGAIFDLRKVPTEEPGMSPPKSGPTNRRNATCWPFRRTASPNSRPCASASAARLPWSGDRDRRWPPDR